MELPVSPSVPGVSSLRSTGGGEGHDVNVKMDSGAYGAAKAGGSFDLRRFLQQPQVIVRAVCMLFAVVVFSCIIAEGYVNASHSAELHCIFNQNEDACRYGTAIGVLAFLASVFFFVVDVYFPQISNATDRKYLVIGDMIFSAFWTFLWFVGFCFLTNQWAATSSTAMLMRADSARAAISFSFFSIFSWGLLAALAYQRYKAGVDDFIQNYIDPTPDPAVPYASYPGVAGDNYQQPPFTQNAETTEGYQPPPVY
ncbi:synaptogyrin-2 [Sarcophilus harrisii]|uniref:Synaptogyrin n=1 Tax=Sarcophilus harrisii TaxID=9305 RepID=A0A7N4PA28_SARHA|nr:synaptogyrin-2 [Sarcophilus harrisii]XP_031821430.1 synaptogyrin-2 [Sarcophilus harrisii]